jgi:NADH:ubiquinone oxidoreductase subunit 5 (subunit L)/multisubunit Na+/H+ antiporter MnhA subunit
MKKYKIMAILAGIFMVLAITTLILGPTWNVKAGEKPENVAADVMLWITLGYVVLVAIAFIVSKIYHFIKHTILKKRVEEDLDEFAINSRSYRSKFDE